MWRQRQSCSIHLKTIYAESRSEACEGTMWPRHCAVYSVLSLGLLLTFQSHSVTGKAHDLNIMLVVSFGQSGFDSSGVIPAANIALEDINKDPNVLPGYNLTYDEVRDSQCHRGRSLDAFFDGIQSGPVKLAVVGCGCSLATEPVAEISHRWNISQLSYASTLAALSDRTRFRRYFRNNLPIASPALRSTMEHFKWRRIALLTQDASLFTVAESSFRSELESANISVESRTFQTTDDPVEHIKDLFNQDYRIFFLNSYSGLARKIICYAHKQNYTSPRYVWMIYDWYPTEWWTQQVSQVEVNCTDSELANFVERSLSFQWRPVADDANAPTDTGKSLSEFDMEYSRRAKPGEFNPFTHGIYDVLWAFAFALNRTMDLIASGDINGTHCENSEGSLVHLHEFNYTNEMMGCLIQWSLQQTDFSGLTGDVKFDDNGTRIYPNVSVLQHQREGTNIVRRKLASLNVHENYSFSFVSGISDNDIYPNGVPPDGTPINITNTFKVEVVAIFYSSAIAGIMFAIVCLLFNVIFRSKRVVRLSSPNLNYFIIFGAVLMYISIFCYLMPTKFKIFVQARCLLQQWLFIIGYTLAFGSVFVKMWRVFHIFNNPQPNKKILTDLHLIAVVMVVVGIAVFLLLFGDAIPRLRDNVTQEVDMENPEGMNDLGVREVHYILVCYGSSSPKLYWQIFIFAYLAVLQIIGIVLAFQTRKVKLPGLRDSKFIAAIIYISSIILVVIALVTFALRTYINIGTGMIAAGIFFLTTVFLALIFIPKMVLLWKDPEGKKVTTVNNKDAPTPNSVDKDMKKIVSLEKNIGERDDIIAKLKDELSDLRKCKKERSNEVSVKTAG